MKNFITIEGCEGVGKTHQTRLLKEYCQSQNFRHIVFTREPGGSNIAEKIRNIVLDGKNVEMDSMCEAFLYAAARIQHLADIVKPSLASNLVVVCDRYVHSSYVYQGIGRRLGLEKIVNLNDIAVAEYMPEFTVFLDLPPELAFERKGGVDLNDRLENVGIDFHRRVYEGYHRLVSQQPDKFVVIDASGTKQETHSKIVQALSQRGVFRENR